MANFNKILLLGNLTRDPQLSYLPSNTPVVEFGLAVNRRFRRQDGEQGEETLFIDCRAFGRVAEILNQYTQKGRPIFIEGRLQLDQWEDREGNKRSKHRVFIENFQFLDRVGGEEGGGYEQAGRGAPRGNAGRTPQSAAPSSGGGSAGPAPMDSEPTDDDIPF